MALLVVALLAPLCGGCLFVAAGAAVGAGVGGYWAMTHRLYRDYPREAPQTLVAVRAALTELGYPAPTEETKDEITSLETKAPDGARVSIELKTIGGRVPADGATTRVGIHIGLIGDEATSVRIHDLVAKHLGLPPPQPAVQSGEQPPLRPVAQPGLGVVETQAPPLAR
jgi:hypothetical protein